MPRCFVWLLIVGQLVMTVWSFVFFYLHFQHLFCHSMWDFLLFCASHSCFNKFWGHDTQYSNVIELPQTSRGMIGITS